MIIGSGPIIIGQACEFDYSGTQACRALRRLGYEICLVNSNPATIMTDPGMADVTCIEPLNLEYMTEIIQQERPDALLPNLGGRAMEVVHDEEMLKCYLAAAVEVSPKRPILISRFLENAIEAEADAIADDTVYILEANPRASRTVPLVSKVCNIPMAKLTTQVMLGKKLADLNSTSWALKSRPPGAPTNFSASRGFPPRRSSNSMKGGPISWISSKTGRFTWW